MESKLITDISGITEQLLDQAKKPSFLPFSLILDGKEFLVHKIDRMIIEKIPCLMLNDSIKLMFSNTYIENNLWLTIRTYDDLKFYLTKIQKGITEMTNDNTVGVYKYDVAKMFSNVKNINRLSVVPDSLMPDYVYSATTNIDLDISDHKIELKSQDGHLEKCDLEFKKFIIKQERLYNLFIYQVPKNQGLDLKSINEAIEYLFYKRKLWEFGKFHTKNTQFFFLRIPGYISDVKLFSYSHSRITKTSITDMTDALLQHGVRNNKIYFA